MTDDTFEAIREHVAASLLTHEHHEMDVEGLHSVFDLELGWYSELLQRLEQLGSPFECSKVGYSTPADLDPNGKILFSRRSA